MKSPPLERIDPETASPEERELHEERYWWAASYVWETDVVLDAACGTGYGAQWFGDEQWVGVDLFECGVPGSQVADLRTWTGWRNIPYDVLIGLETIEHLDALENYVEMAKAARSRVLISTPIVPTSGVNPYHVRDFTRQEVVDLFTDETWELEDFVEQPPVYGGFAFRRR